MDNTRNERDVIRRLADWAERQPAVRAMLLTRSRANPHACVDALSDYDIVLVVEDIHSFYEDRTWLSDFGQVLVAYWDPIFCSPEYGLEQTGNVTQYADGIEIDFSLWPVELLRQIALATVLPAALDTGYRVLVDKDHLTGSMPAPTYTAYVPSPPTAETYQSVVNDLFSDVPYVAKCLWRSELLPAKWCLDEDMKHEFLLRMLEWRMECDHGWSVPAGHLGRGLQQRLPAEIWSQLEHTYVGAGIADNWEALFRTIALFRQVAIEVAARLGHEYPMDLDERVTAHTQRVRGLGHRAARLE